MSIKSFFAKQFARTVVQKMQRWVQQPEQTQERVFKQLIEQAKNTKFGKDHGFDKITSYTDFANKVPIRTYEELRPYVDAVVAGESDVLWPEKPLYFAKTSGTTSGAKFIPITKQSIRYQVEAARNALLCYIHE
ncbi:MAG: GH3 auxin-responsive promoter family protein, partial [Flavobacteriaceae bacterium]|nr:GH3 auxin-responsive promoter family protein [Flavobacteriaceae bacterium]